MSETSAAHPNIEAFSTMRKRIACGTRTPKRWAAWVAIASGRTAIVSDHCWIM